MRVQCNTQTHIWRSPSNRTEHRAQPSSAAINWDLFAIIFYYFIKCLWKKCARRSWFISAGCCVYVCIISIASAHPLLLVLFGQARVCVCTSLSNVYHVYNIQRSVLIVDCAFFKRRTFFTANKDFKRKMCDDAVVIQSRWKFLEFFFDFFLFFAFELWFRRKFYNAHIHTYNNGRDLV